jgi:hypothetical protein
VAVGTDDFALVHFGHKVLKRTGLDPRYGKVLVRANMIELQCFRMSFVSTVYTSSFEFDLLNQIPP